MNYPKLSQIIEPESLEVRKEIALSVAKECIQLLKENYAVTEVILFGSLAGDSPWHWASDLDLAVVGLSNPQWWKAYGELESLCPSCRTWWQKSSPTMGRLAVVST
jgi:predicted nucleotidyltransferase